MRHGIEEFVTHLGEAPTIEVKDGIAFIRGRSGNVPTVRSMSLRCLATLVDRGQRALTLYAEGEKSVIVDD